MPWCYSEAYFQIAEETQTDSNPSREEQQKSERGGKTSENIRYGEAISEHGFGGETTTSSGETQQGLCWSPYQALVRSGCFSDCSFNVDGLGGTSAQIDEGDAAQSRREQGYGRGSGVGA